jgi:hypothetical protein
MKKFSLSILLINLSFSVFATILTVSNAAHQPAQFSSVQAAHDAASAGDTLLVSGTGMSYGDLTITKQLSIIGSTFVPGYAAQFSTIFFGGSTCDGTLLESLYIGSVQVPTGFTQTNFSNHIIRRCYLYSIYADTPQGANANHFYNWLIEGCVFIGTGGLWNMNTAYGYSRFENFTFRNNVFNGTLLDIKFCSLENNIFLGTVPSESCVNGIEYSTFANNIAYGRSVSGGYSNVYNNNVSFAGSDNVFSTTSGNISSNNIQSSDPMFVNVTLGSNFNLSSDYHLQAGSPAIGAGDNGLDCGVYDGSGIFRMDGEPDIPVVRSVIIPGGNLVPAQSTFQITVNSVSHQ